MHLQQESARSTRTRYTRNVPVPVVCALCSAPSQHLEVVTRHVFGDSEGRAFFKCNQCSVIFLFPQLSDDEERRFYAEEFGSFMARRSGEAGGWESGESHLAANRAVFERRREVVGDLFNNIETCLELGSSSGFMLKPLLDRGVACTGIEPSGIFAEFSRSLGIETYSDLAECTERGARFDLVMHFFVLEHLRDPVGVTKQLLSLVRPGGHLVFEVPCSLDPLVSLLQVPAFEHFYWSVAHRWYFDPTSLKFVVDACQLPVTLLPHQRYGYDNHFVWARDGRPGGEIPIAKAMPPGFNEMYKDALVRSGHFDTVFAMVKVPA